MSTAGAARRIATAAAYGGGGLGLLGGAVWALLAMEATIAIRTIGPALTDPPDPDGIYDPSGGIEERAPLSLAVLGDSAAASFGVDRSDETMAAMLAGGLAELSGRRVHLTSTAVVGALTKDLDPQVDQAIAAQADVAVIVVGANDVTHLVRPAESVRLLTSVVRRLRAAGCAVVVGTCPDLGTVEPIAFPLRQILRSYSRRLAAAQTVGVVEVGGRTISLGSLLGPEFAAAPRELFGPDRFHPSVTGYASAAAALLPSVADVVDCWDSDGETLDALTGVVPVSFAAARAAADDGTEVAATELGGRVRGPRGRWAELRQRLHPGAEVPQQRPSEGVAGIERATSWDRVNGPEKVAIPRTRSAAEADRAKWSLEAEEVPGSADDSAPARR